MSSLSTDDFISNIDTLLDLVGIIKTEYLRLDDKKIKQAGRNVCCAVSRANGILKQINLNTKFIRHSIPKKIRSNTFIDPNPPHEDLADALSNILLPVDDPSLRLNIRDIHSHLPSSLQQSVSCRLLCEKIKNLPAFSPFYITASKNSPAHLSHFKFSS